MALHQKSYRRLKITLVGVVLLAAGAATAYGLRVRYLERRALAYRAQGLEEVKSGDYYNALHHLGSYLQRHPEDPDVLFPYARARKNVEEPDGKHVVDAMRFYRRLLDLQPNHVEAARDLIELYQGNGLDTEAVGVADVVLRNSPDDAKAMMAKATSLARLRRFDAALQSLEPHFALRPLDVDGRMLALAIMGRSQVAPEQLSTYVEALREKHPKSPACDLLQSVVCSLRNDQEGGKKFALQAAAAKSTDVSFVLGVLRQLEGLELFKEAFAFVARAASETADVRVKSAYAARLYQTKRFDELLKIASGGTAEDADVAAYRCLVLLQQGRKAEAVEAAKELGGRQYNPPAAAWSEVLLAEINRGENVNSRETIRVCSQALKRLPEQAVIHQFIASAYAATGETEAAVRHWQAAVRAAPSWAEPFQHLSDVLIRAGRVDDAVSAANAACRRAPDDVAPMLSLARAWSVAVRGGRAERAGELLTLTDKILQRDPGNEQVLPIRVQLLAQTGKRQAAIDETNAILAAKTPVSEVTLLQLALVSKDAQLGLTAQCLAASEKLYGLTPDLTFIRARQLYDDGQTQQGIALLDTARRQGTGDAKAWGIAWAKYLDLVKDPRALAEWIAVADRFPDSTDVQWMAISAPAVQQDRAFVGRILDRLRTQIGESGLTWRLTRAQFLLQNQASSKDAVEAALILNEVSRSAPDLLAPRLLLANCLERLGNISGAIEQLSIASNLNPGSNPIALELARLLQTRGDFVQARSSLDRVVSSGTATIAQIRTAALLMAQQGDIETSLKLLESNTNVSDLPADLALAMIYRRRSETTKVAAIVKKLLAEQSPDPAAIAFAADYAAVSGHRQEAETVLDRLNAMKLPPGQRELIRADFYRVRGPEELAVQQYRAAAKAAPEDATPWRRLTSLYLERGRGAEALATLADATKAIPADRSFEIAMRLSKQYDATVEQDKPYAAALLQWLLQSQTDEPAVGAALTSMAEAAADGAKAARLPATLRAMADKNPRVLPLQLAAAHSCLAGGRPDDAAAVALRAMELAPNSPQPAQVAAKALAAAGRWGELLKVAQKWRERNVEDPTAADVMIALAHIQLKNAPAAIRHLQSYLPVEAANADARRGVLFQYARALIAEGKAAEAATLLRPMLSRSPDWRVDWTRLAVIDLGEPTVAAAWLKELEQHIPAESFQEQLVVVEGWQALARSSGQSAHADVVKSMLGRIQPEAEKKGTAETLLSLGCIQEAQGDVAGAVRSYRRSIQLNGRLAIAQNNLAMLLAKSADGLGEALSLAQQAVSMSRENRASFYDTLAYVQGKRGDREEALRSIKAAIDLDPANAVFRVRLASLLKDSGQVERASAELEEIDKLYLDKNRIVSQQLRDEVQSLRSELARLQS